MLTSSGNRYQQSLTCLELPKIQQQPGLHQYIPDCSLAVGRTGETFFFCHLNLETVNFFFPIKFVKSFPIQVNLKRNINLICFCLPIIAILLLPFWSILFALSIMTIVACGRYLNEIYSHCKLVCYCTIFFIFFPVRVNLLPKTSRAHFSSTCYLSPYSAESVAVEPLFNDKYLPFLWCLVCILISLSLPFPFLARFFVFTIQIFGKKC